MKSEFDTLNGVLYTFISNGWFDTLIGEICLMNSCFDNIINAPYVIKGRLDALNDALYILKGHFEILTLNGLTILLKTNK